MNQSPAFKDFVKSAPVSGGIKPLSDPIYTDAERYEIAVELARKYAPRQGGVKNTPTDKEDVKLIELPLAPVTLFQ